MAAYRKVVEEVLAAVHPDKVARGKAAQLASHVVNLEAAMAAVVPPNSEFYDVTVC